MENSEALFAQLEVVRESGVDMSDARAVKLAAHEKELEVLEATIAGFFTEPEFERSRDYGNLIGNFKAWREGENEEEPESGPSETVVEPSAVAEPDLGITESAEDETPVPGGDAPSDGEPETGDNAASPEKTPED